MLKIITIRGLCYYQIIAVIVSMTIISFWAFNEGGMMLFYIFFAGLLFLPFLIVSIFSLLDIDKHRHTTQNAIWIGTILLIIPSYFLPFFFEWGGILIALLCSSIGAYIWIKRKEVESQITIFNILGAAILTIIFISLVVIGLT